MEIKEVIGQIDKGYTALQNLVIQPTKGNIEGLREAMTAMEMAYKYLTELPEKEGEPDV